MLFLSPVETCFFTSSPVISFQLKKMAAADWRLLLSIVSFCLTWNTLYARAPSSGHLSVWRLSAQTSFSNLFQ